MMQSILTTKISLVIFFILYGYGVFSQNSNDYINQIKKEYPEDNFVQLNKVVQYDIVFKKGKLEILQTEKEKYIYLKNVKTLPITLNTFNSSNRELLNYEAYSYVSNNGKYKKIKVNEYNEKMNVDNRTFYDDIKELTFTFPGVTEGTIIELNTVHKINKPQLLNNIYLSSYIPIREFEFRIEYDKNIDIDLVKMNFEGFNYPISQKEDKRAKIYSSSIQNIEKIIPEDYEPDNTYFIPHIIPIIRGYNLEGEYIDILKNSESLHNWYYNFISDIVSNKSENKEIKQIVDSVLTNCNDEFEKVEKLYYWIQKNIKYISFEYGMGGLVPRSPETTIKNRYGDCKDKSSLLFEMLKTAGIKSYLTWIGTYDIPYSYSDVPTPIADNHMIVTYINDGNYYFLDGTSEYLNITFPSTFIQGKEALISIDKQTFEIKKVPTVHSNENKISESISLQIKNNGLHGDGMCTITGYHKSDLQYGLFLKNKQEQKKLMEENLEKGNNKFVLNDYSISDLNTFKPELNINYSFNLNNYINSFDNTLYINLNLDKDWLGYKLKKDRKHPLFLPFCTSGEDSFKLQIPEGYTVTFLPKNYSYNDENFGFSITYTIEENTIIYNQKINVNSLLIENDQFKNWNSFIKELENAYKQTILLKKDEI